MRVNEPSDRHFEIFCEVEHGGMSLRVAAAKWQLSPGRIQQIVDQVRSWYRANGPGRTDADPIARAEHGFHLLEERLSYLSSEVMAAWRASQTEVTTRREQPNKPGSAVLTTVRGFGQVRYLAMAMRLAEARCNAGVRHALFCQKLGRKNVTVSPFSEPPTGGYAPEDVAAEQVEAEETEHVAASDDKETVCDAAQVTEFTVSLPESPISNPMRSRLAKKLARHEKRKAARERKRSRQLA